MESWIISIIIVVIFCFLTLSIGLFGWAKKLDRSAKDFFVASRTLGFIALFFTYTATYHSASAFLGTGGFLYSHGMSYWAIGPFTQALGGLLLYIFGSRIWLLGQKYDYFTPGDLLADFYDSKALKVLTGIVLVAFVVPYVQLQLSGAGWIAEFVTYEKIPYAQGALGLGIVVLIYVFLGGMRSVAWTDVFMGIFMFLAIIIGCWYLTYKLYGSQQEAWAMVFREAPELLVLPGKATYFQIPMAFSWTIVITLGLSVCAPHVIMRMFSAGSIRILKWVAVLSPLYLIWIYISYVWYGIATGAASPGLEHPDRILPMGLFEHTPVVFAALICAGGLAATLSTANSQLHAASALFTRDVYQSMDETASDKRIVSVTRIAVLVIFGFSYYASLNKPEFLSMLVSVATGGMAQLTPLLVGALFWPRATKQGALVGFVSGSLVMVWFQFARINLLGMMPGLWALLVNFTLFIIVSKATPPPSKEKILKFHGYLNSDEAKTLLKS